MKKHIVPSIKLTVLLIVLCTGFYPALILGIAQLSPGEGKGVTVEQNGKVVGFERVGQKFTDDRYFWSRPSAVEYNAAGSGGSNKGPSNPEYLATVQARIDTFLVHHPGVTKAEIPADMVTASGSGLDPHISVQGAMVQVNRLAKVRNVSTESLKKLILERVEHPLMGFFGTSTVNVLQLNLALDQGL